MDNSEDEERSWEERMGWMDEEDCSMILVWGEEFQWMVLGDGIDDDLRFSGMPHFGDVFDDKLTDWNEF